MNNAALSDPLDLLLRRFSFEFFQNLFHLAVILLNNKSPCTLVRVKYAHLLFCHSLPESELIMLRRRPDKDVNNVTHDI